LRLGHIHEKFLEAVAEALRDLASYISQIESGTMRALAVTSAQRWPTLPNVPTMAEAGVPDFVVTSWAPSHADRNAAVDR
jgi:tripartite-type tricarboxylate transporter receptor subunit TctC